MCVYRPVILEVIGHQQVANGWVYGHNRGEVAFLVAALATRVWLGMQGRPGIG